MRNLLKLILKLWWRLEVRGDVSALGAGRTLVIAAHGSVLDGIVLGAVLPPNATIVLDAEDLRFPPVRTAARGFRHETLALAEPSAVKKLVRLLEAGGPVAVFPEGRVEATGALMRLYDAVAAAAARTGATIVPVTITGLTYSAFGGAPGTHRRLRRPRVTVTVHAPVALPDRALVSAKAQRRDASDTLAGILHRAAVEARPRRTLFEALVDSADTFGRATPILEDIKGKVLTYGDLLRAALALGRLGSRLAPPGEPVGVLMPNVAATVGLVFGLSATGRTPALLNYTAGPEAIAGACAAAGIRTVITSRQFIESARLYPLLDALCRHSIVFVEDLRERFGWRDKLWLLTRARWAPRSLVTACNPGGPAVVLFTSGSESQPKGVALSHDGILANIAQMRAVFDFSPADRFMNALPLFHSYGLTACTLMPLLAGTPLYLYTTPLHYRAIPEIAYRRDCTVLFGTGTFLAHYGREAHPYDFARVRVVISGGEKLSPEVGLLWLQKFAVRIYEGYGATECSPVLALNTPLGYRSQTTGRFLPHIEWRLEPVEGIEQGGRLHVRGPNLMLGYLRIEQPGVIEPPQSKFGAGWYDTGDVVSVDADGYATVLGRVKRFAKIAGEMVALEMVERVAVHASPQHQHAATVEMVPGLGESTVLFTTDPQLNRGLLHRSARLLGSQDLAVARRIVPVPELPMLGSGKTDYVKLKDLADRTRLALVASNGEIDE
jgi:acyl-[acyl-carrier-protein]-phospholipid O-acyltransferase/long-chain-fatty-acid--[acyl-carrier-protein] ligase